MTDTTAGLRVFVAEDEALVSMLVEDMLAEIGCTVVGPAANLDEALTLARDSEIDKVVGLESGAASGDQWDNTSAKHIGYRPLDSSEPFRAAVEAKQLTLDLNDPAVIYQGGGFVKAGPF